MPSVVELKEKAKARGIRGYANMKKEELCRALGFTDDCSMKRRKPARKTESKSREKMCGERALSISFLREHDFVKGLNCFELPLKDVKYILGPCSFYQYKFGDRNIYFFGEEHASLGRDVRLMKGKLEKTNTLSFSAFIHSLVTQNPEKTYDLMFEGAYFLSKHTPEERITYETTSPTFTDLSYHYESCIHFAKRKACPYNNLRVHYVDYRESKDIEKGEEDLSEEAILAKINLLLKSGKTLKQISAIKEDYIREAIIDFFIDWVTRSPEDAGTSQAAVMDLYAIARVLRDFDPIIDKQDDRSFRGTAQNVIYYAGDEHINTAVRFMRYIGFQPDYYVNDERPSCKSFLEIDMKKAKF